MTVCDLEGFRVLVVDDNAPSRQLLVLILTAGGASVSEAGDGQSAVNMWVDGDFDAILMDVQMPVLDGLQATRQIRERGRDARGRRPLIVGVTAHAMLEHRQACLDAGMDDVITKPIDPDTVVATVRSLLDRAEAADEA